MWLWIDALLDLVVQIVFLAALVTIAGVGAFAVVSVAFWPGIALPIYAGIAAVAIAGSIFKHTRSAAV